MLYLGKKGLEVVPNHEAEDEEMADAIEDWEDSEDYDEVPDEVLPVELD